MNTQTETPKVAYETDHVKLGLYWQGPGSPFPEASLVGLYLKTKEQGLLERSFTGLGKSVTLNGFISYLSTRPVVIGIDKKNNNVVGYGYLAESEVSTAGKKASAGYAFFKEYWGTQQLRDLTRITLEHWFVAMDINVLYGSMEATNRLAFRFATKELGFHMLCRLPKFYVTDEGLFDGILVVLEREEFLSKLGG